MACRWGVNNQLIRQKLVRSWVFTACGSRTYWIAQKTTWTSETVSPSVIRTLTRVLPINLPPESGEPSSASVIPSAMETINFHRDLRDIIMRWIAASFTAQYAAIYLVFAANKSYNHLQWCSDYYVDIRISTLAQLHLGYWSTRFSN